MARRTARARGAGCASTMLHGEGELRQGKPAPGLAGAHCKSDAVGSLACGSNVVGKKQTQALLPGEGWCRAGAGICSAAAGQEGVAAPSLLSVRGRQDSAAKPRHLAFFPSFCVDFRSCEQKSHLCLSVPWQPKLHVSCEHFPSRAPCALSALSHLPCRVSGVWILTRKTLPSLALHRTAL